MPLNTLELASALGAGQSLEEIAGTAGASVEEARRLWEELILAKVPPSSARLDGKVGAPVEVVRDSYGVAHVYAQSEADLFFGLGFAMAQDRLWQMDYLRRKATGRLAEPLGPTYVDQDFTYRVLDFPTICARNYDLLAPRWRTVLDGMAAGVNRAIEQASGNLPV